MPFHRPRDIYQSGDKPDRVALPHITVRPRVVPKQTVAFKVRVMRPDDIPIQGRTEYRDEKGELKSLTVRELIATHPHGEPGAVLGVFKVTTTEIEP